MPTVARFSSCKIAMYAADHNPPHFHIRMSDGREAAQNTALLIDKWAELNP